MTRFKKKQIFPYIVIWFFFLATLVFAQEGALVRSILVQGNHRVDTSTVLFYIKTQSGQPLSKSQIRKDIEQIYSLGQFKDIQVETKDVDGQVDVIFKVVEISSIGDVNLVGNDKVLASDIRDKLGLKRGATFHEHLLRESSETILELYREKGFFFAEVNIETEKTKENLVDVNIRIHEGEKVKIEKLRFAGNKSIPDKELKGQVQTQEKSWLSFIDESGIYKKDILKLDMFRVEGYYHDKGFMRVRVLEPKIDINRSAKQIHITIPVEEGVQYHVGKVALKGDGTLTDEEILKVMKAREGDVYNASQVREDVLSVADLFSQRGYAYADVNPITHIDDAARKVDLEMSIEKGRKVYVGQISIAGNNVTRDNVIRREFRLKEGELFDSEKLKRSKQRINNLRFFEDVKVDTRRGDNPELIDIETTLTERPTGSVTVGAGFSSVENLVFTTSIAQDNLFGRGQHLAFTANLSSIRSDFNVNFTDPRMFDTEILGGVDLFNQESDFFSFNRRSRGMGLRSGKSVSEWDWVGLNYRFENVKVTDVDPSAEDAFLKNETRVTSRIVPSYVRDTRDDFLNPSTGSRHVLRFELAGGILGGSDFVKTSYEGTYYQPLLGKLVGAVHAEFNWADAYSGDNLPAFERFFMGGPNSLRGYTIRDIGPKDSTGDPIGGNQSLLLNLELQYPFTNSFRGFLFYDRGNVYGGGFNTATTESSFDLGAMRDSIGAGIRFISPFGPLGFAYGVKLDKQEGEKAAEFHFTAGSAF